MELITDIKDKGNDYIIVDTECDSDLFLDLFTYTKYDAHFVRHLQALHSIHSKNLKYLLNFFQDENKYINFFTGV
jgi:hypothetical protein